MTSPDDDLTVRPPTPRQVLDTPVSSGNTATIGDLLRGLLTGLWRDDADARVEVYTALVEQGHILGSFDHRGELHRADTATANRLILSVIDALTVPPGTPAEHDAQATVALSRGTLAAMEVCNMPGPDGEINITITDVLEAWRDSLGDPPDTPHDDTARS